jgi:hypothetical protein
MAQRGFFALREDLISLLAAVERTGALRYFETGMFESADRTAFSCGVEIPALGEANDDSSVGCASYLVVEPSVMLNVRSVTTIHGQRFCVDQLINEGSITFQGSGARGPAVILAGRVSTASNSPEARALLRRFQSAISKQFTKVRAFWVGPAARVAFDSGARLTFSVGAPRSYDLSVESP